MVKDLRIKGHSVLNIFWFCPKDSNMRDLRMRASHSKQANKNTQTPVLDLKSAFLLFGHFYMNLIDCIDKRTIKSVELLSFFSGNWTVR